MHDPGKHRRHIRIIRARTDADSGKGEAMATVQEIQQAIEDVDARLDALRERIVAGGEHMLSVAEEWRVRDALSHLAARANGVQRVVDRAEAAADGSAPARPPTSIDDINAGQIAERTDRSVEQLLDEIREGHGAAISAVQGLSAEFLEREIPMGFRPGNIAVGDMIARGGPGHDSNHLDDIESSLGA
jgi:hypothetical protein